MRNFIRLATVFVLSALLSSGAFAQSTGQLAAGGIWGNPTAAKAPASGTTLSAIVDRSLSCSAQGDIIFRGASLWTCLAPGTSGLPLISGGAGANVAYGALGLGSLATGSVDTVIGYWASTTASALAINNCVGALQYSTGSHAFGCFAQATASNYFAGTASKVITPDVIYTAETTTTFGSTTTFDFNTFINTAVTLTGNITTQTLSNVTAGKSGTITFIQDGTGSRTTVWNSVFKFSGGVTPTLTTTASAIDVLSYSCRSSTVCVASLLKDVR